MVYRKYEGRKMTVPVRRHAYVRHTYLDLLFREDSLTSSIYADLPLSYRLKHQLRMNIQNGNNSKSIQKSNDDASSSSSSSSLENSRESGSMLGRILDLILPNRMESLNGRNALNQSQADKNELDDGENKKVDAKFVLNFNDKFYVDRLLASKSVNFILPLTGRWDIFKRFMVNYENVCLKANENTKLVIVLFESEFNSGSLIQDKQSGRLVPQSELIQNLIDFLRVKYAGKVNDQSLIMIKSSLNFSRSIGCELGAAFFKPQDLLFFIDVDILFTSDFMLRARLNTIEFKQVYYPIVYSEYDPDDSIEAVKVLTDKVEITNSKNSNSRQRMHSSHFEFDVDTGYWRQFGFGIVSVYGSDLKRVGGFDTSIVGWGKEDVELYEKFIKSNLTIFRSVDPGLIHIFHKIECDASLAEEQMIMCMGSKATSIASQRILANLVYEEKSYLIKPKLDATAMSHASNTSTVHKVNKVAVNKIRTMASVEKNVQ